MKRKVAVLVCLFILFAGQNIFAAWKPGYFHGGHTFYSDGARTATQLKDKAYRSGAKFFVSSDHYEQIKVGERPQYLKDFSGYYKGMLLIPGVEFSRRTGESHSHLLAFLGAENFFGQNLSDNLYDLIGQIGMYGGRSIAAHPNVVSQYANFYFDRSVLGFNGVELFNGDFYTEDLDWYLELTADWQKVFVTSGNDSHTGADPLDKKRWLRKTYVWVDGDLTEGNFTNAIFSGRTCAVNNYAYPKKMNLVPALYPQQVNRPFFNFQIAFSKATTKPTSCRVYRNGVLIWDSIRNFSKGKTSITYKWQDDYTSMGYKSYVFEVSNYLVTSPIILEVTAPSPLGFHPIFDCFRHLSIGAFSSGSWEERSYTFGWKDGEFSPVENPTVTFFKPARVEIYAVFENVFPSTAYPGYHLPCMLAIYDSQGRLVDDAQVGIYTYTERETCWIKFQKTLENAGRYEVELRSVNNALLAKKDVLVY